LAGALVLGLLSLSGTVHAQSAPSHPASDGRDTAHYTADRPLDFLHMRLELTFTPDGLQSRTCEGRVEYTLQPRAAKLNTVRLDAMDMKILAVDLSGEEKAPTLAYDDKILTVQLPRPIGPEQTFKLAVRYRLEDPPKGMHFVLPNRSQPKRPLMVYTMSEPLEARYWFPTHDWPNARWTSDILVTAPAVYTVVSNGVLYEKKLSADGQTATFHWINEIPTDPHLTGMVLGELVELRDSWRDHPVLVYTQPGSEEAARYTCRRVPEMLEFYTKLLGIHFPYRGYSHISVVNHHHGGMEHAGFSFVDPRFFATNDDGDYPLENTESIYLSHMLAHQWFGGMVNYRSVSQAWLNEGFAILLDSLWTSHTDSPHRFACKMWNTAKSIAAFDASENGKPLVNRDLKDVEDVYQYDGGKIYYKGGWVLNMLRHQLGDELFWRGVERYLRSHIWQSVETSDLRRALEEVSGRDLEQFFQQWVYGHGVPRLEVEYAWDVERKRATVTVRQTQKIDTATPAFVFPLDLFFRSGDEDKDVTVHVDQARQEFTFDFPAEPSLFCVDPRGGLLKTLAVQVPRAMLIRQAKEGPTALARLMAVETLGRQASPEAIETLEHILLREREFWMVRRAAAAGLGSMQTDEALQALLRVDKIGAGHPRVLAGLVEALGGYIVSPEAHAAILRYTEAQKSLYVEMAAVTALGQMRASPELVERSLTVLQAAARKPVRRAVRSAAFQSLAALDDPRAYDPLMELAQAGQDDELRNQVIPILGRLGRRDNLRDRTRATLTAWLYDPDRGAQQAALTGLGMLGDPRAIADLTRVHRSVRSEDLRQAAQRAIEAIRQPPDPKQATAALLERLTALEKQNQDLEKQLKDLAAKLDAMKEAPPKKTGEPKERE
jgi:aminopeptidase N